MNVLYVTNMFPWKNNPYYGIFVKEQIEGLKKYHPVKDHVIFINGKKGKWHYLSSIFTINFHFLFNSYDIVHIHYGLSGLFALFNPFIRTPLVTTLHSGDIDVRKAKYVQIFITKLLLRKTHHVIILNEEMKQIVQGINPNFDRIPCGVDTEVFQPKILKQKSTCTQKLHLVFPGSPERKAKNFPLFQEVIKCLSDLHHKIIEYSVIENKTRSEVAEMFNTTDCIVLTSLSEGSPQVIKEAMACNANIVATNVGDVNVLLKNVTNARVIDNFNPEEIAQAIIEVIKYSGARQGRDEIFQQNLDEKSISSRVYDTYINATKNYKFLKDQSTEPN